MKGDRSLATSWPIVKKLWQEATMEQLGPSRGTFSVKSASFQVGEDGDLGQAACLSESHFFFGINECRYPSGAQDHQQFVEPQGKNLVISKPCSKGLGWSRAARSSQLCEGGMFVSF